MRIKGLIIVVIVATILTSCKEQVKESNTDSIKTEKAIATPKEKISQSLTDKDGNTLEMSFDNSKNIVTVKFDDEISELKGQKPASGIWYENDEYELRGKGNNIQLKKDGKIIFEHQDDIVSIESTNDLGDVLNMTFNNTEGTVKAYLNGGEQIDLVEERSASGVWYKNDQYVLRGKGESYELLKNGIIIYKN